MSKRGSILLIISLMAAAPFVYGQAGIGSVRPDRGAVGTKVTIVGSGFLCSNSEVLHPWVQGLSTESPPGKVEFNGVPAEVISWHDTVIQVKVPMTAKSGPLSITLPNCQLALDGGRFDVRYDGTLTEAERPDDTKKPGHPTPPSNGSRAADARSQLHRDQLNGKNAGAGARPARPSSNTEAAGRRAQPDPAIRPPDSGALAKAFQSGYESFLKGEFADTVAQLQTYIEGNGSEKAKALFYRGAAKCAQYFLEGEKTRSLLDEARNDFRAAKQQQADFLPPAELISPKILRVYTNGLATLQR